MTFCQNYIQCLLMLCGSYFLFIYLFFFLILFFFCWGWGGGGGDGVEEYIFQAGLLFCLKWKVQFEN